MPKRTRKESPKKQAMRKMMREYLKNNDVSIKDGSDVNEILRDMMSVLLEGVLDEELDEELGYSRYDYRNKETENSRNGHSKKPCIPVTATWMLRFRETGKANSSLRLSGNIRIL